MAEGTSLLRKHTAYTRIVGSNPTVSAKYHEKSHRKVAFLIPGSADEKRTCARFVWDSKGCAYSRNRGLQHVGESHRLRQVS